jgi:hypothetical protein
MSDDAVTLRGMTGDRVRLAATLRAQEAVISRRQALACGVTRSFLAHRLRPDGPWQRLCPGVYLAQTGAPSVPQKEMAALLHAGPGSVLTGAAALYGLGLTALEPARFDVLVPRNRRRESVAFIAVRRSARMPERVIRNGRRQYALPPRAFADAARGLTELGEVRALIAGAVQQGVCPPAALARELGEGPVRQSALLRQVLGEVADGVRSGPEGDFRGLIRRSRLPMPMFNARLYAADGSFIACPDAWWKDAGVAGEVDSKEWHLGPDGWQRTLRRHATMSAHGILVLHFTPAEIRSSPATVVAKIAGSLNAGRARAALPITARSAA